MMLVPRIWLAGVFLSFCLALAPLAFAQQQQDKALSGNVSSKVFHRESCRHYSCKNCTARFSSREEALKAGYRPCQVCKP